MTNKHRMPSHFWGFISKQHWVIKAFLLPFVFVAIVLTIVASNVWFAETDQVVGLYLYFVGLTCFLLEKFDLPSSMTPDYVFLLRGAFLWAILSGIVGIILVGFFRLVLKIKSSSGF